MYELSIESHFSAAHYLKGYEGKCKNLHGHTFKVEVTVMGDQLDELGMVADFGILKERLNDLLETMDHSCLSDLEYFKDINPTSENIAKLIYEQYSVLVSPLEVKCVRVWESDTSCVLYKR